MDTQSPSHTAIERRPLDSLRPRPNNPRTHSDEQVSQLADSIRLFGFTNPLLIESDGTIVAGHGRLLAARAAGLTEVPCVVLTGLTPEEVRALVIADNQLALNAGWDEAILAEELKALDESAFDLSVLGFAQEELERFMAEVTEETTSEQEERAQLLARGDITIDEPTSDVHAGDTWYLGRHVLVVADVLRQHARWKHHLQDDVILLPYAGPFALATDAAAESRLLIVQPEVYIAGHIIDRFSEWHQGERVEVQREGDPPPAGVVP